MKEKLILELTPKQYQQLVETLHVGGVRLDNGRWPLDKSGHRRLMEQVISQAGKFGKEHITLQEQKDISRELDDQLMPWLFDDI